MIAACVAILLATIPYSPVIHDRVCVAELNHFYDDEGHHVFDQRIFYDADGMVIGWRMVKRPTTWMGEGDWLFWDKDGLRRVKAVSEIETWSQVDRELEARSILQPSDRRELGSRP